MLFNSLHFLVFFPVVVFLYFLLPHKWRNLFLVIASSYFYMVFVPSYILILAFLIIIDYFTAIIIERTDTKYKKKLLVISIFSNIGILFVFKYFNFFNENIALLVNLLDWNYSIEYLKIALPVGLSFHTFQSLSYVVEVFRGNFKAERNFITYALYVMFFPQLVAGPIERPQHLLPQLRIFHSPSALRIVQGLRLMLWGFFKKIVVADNLAVVVGVAYGDPGNFGGLSLVVATICFMFQIYFDFSGYSDIAIGGARILGIELSPNFDRPFEARSIAIFWRRWHMSLTNWFHDYVFVPLYMKLSRIGVISKLEFRYRHALAFSLATLIGLSLLGLWHGANWTFVLFGLSQAVGILIYYTTRLLWDNLYAPVGTSLTLLIFFIGSVFFRAPDSQTAFFIFESINRGLLDVFGSLPDLVLVKEIFSSIGFSRGSLLLILCSTVFVLVCEKFGVQKPSGSFLERVPRAVRYGFYYSVLFVVIFCGYIGKAPFIYFQF